MKTSDLVGGGLIALSFGRQTRVFFCLLLLPAALLAQVPQQLLIDMGNAIERLNYKGTLVYMQPGRAETFRVYHRVVGDQVSEKVVAMDGNGIEIIRTPDEVICIFPSQRRVVVDKRNAGSLDLSPLKASLPKISPAILDNYALQLLGEGRVAARRAFMLSITPQDEYRYGYRLWLDSASNMPLKIQLLDGATAMPVEELFFTSISLPEVLDEALVKPGDEAASFSWVRRGEGNDLVSAPIANVRWRPAILPDGFMEMIATVEYMAESLTTRTHLVYSDGLASVSVFVDAGVAASEQAEGLTTVGATNAYSRMVDGFLVTAMGEVPARTVQLIATSMELLPDSAAQPVREADQ